MSRKATRLSRKPFRAEEREERKENVRYELTFSCAICLPKLLSLIITLFERVFRRWETFLTNRSTTFIYATHAQKIYERAETQTCFK